MSEQDDRALEQEIKDSLGKLEQWFPAATPKMDSFLQLVEEQKSLRRRKLKKELFLFGTIALVTVTIGVLGLAQVPVVYAAAQGVLLVGFVTMMALSGRKRADSA